MKIEFLKIQYKKYTKNLLYKQLYYGIKLIFFVWILYLMGLVKKHKLTANNLIFFSLSTDNKGNDRVLEEIMAFGANAYGGYNTYKQVGVKTASQGKLVVMLYEGAISNLEKAMALVDDEKKIQPKNIEAYGNYLQKVMDIITELQVSLDMAKGGEIASNLFSLYIFFNKQILDATISHDKSKLSFVHNMLSELHESWLTAANSTANASTSIPGAAPALNIQG